MVSGTWAILPRDTDLTRDLDPIVGWSRLTVIERHNVLGVAAGTWVLDAPTGRVESLLAPGRGVILLRTSPDGGTVERIMSGPTSSIRRGAVTSTISGVSDTDSVLGGRLIFPDPTKPITAQPVAYDNRSGPAETVILGYVNANAGPAATTARRTFGLRVPATQGRGSAVSITGRLDSLAAVVADVAEAGGLHVEIIHSEDATGPYLGFAIRPVVDRSPDVRFGNAGDATGGTIGSDWSYELGRPTVTDALVAGGGQLTERVFAESVDAAAEALWNTRVEVLVDQRQTTDPTELQQAGDDALSGGAEPVAVSFTISDSYDVRYRRDWRAGDRVGVSLDGLDLSGPVREVTTVVTQQSNDSTENIKAVVGSRDSSNWSTKQNREVAAALRALAKLKAT